MASVIRVENLTKEFNGINVVDKLSFCVEKGDIYGFLGQNGAGKSTTIRMLLTLIKPTAGSIHIFSQDLHTYRNAILAKTGAIIERPDLYNFLSPYENLSLFAKMSGISLKRNEILNQLDTVGLAERWNSKVKTFSQGMKQRLGIAVALVHNPSLVILDEPTNGLDPQGIADMREMIISLSKKHGKTVLLSSHLLSEIEVIATRMLVIHKGRKVAEGKVQDLLDPADTIVYIETMDNIRATRLLENSGYKISLPPGDGVILVKAHKDRVPEIIRILLSEGISIFSVTPRHSLEAYFLSLTNQQTNVSAFKH